MSYVDIEIVKHFILLYALRGPEEITDDGQFEDGLLSRSRIVTNREDSVLCPYI